MTRDSRPELNTPWSGDLPSAFGLYDPPSSTTPAASRSSSTSRGEPATRSSRRASARSATSTTAARRGPRRTPATAPASRSRSPTASCGRSSTSPCRPRAPTASASRSCRPRSADAEKASPTSRRSSASEGLRVLGWRDVPVDDSMIGRRRPQRHAELPPAVRRRGAGQQTDRHRRSTGSRSWCASAASTRSATSVYFPSLSCRTLVYKGMLTTPQLSQFFPDLGDERVESALALVHCRFSHQHVPVVAARAPVPLHRAQRRDQHGAGQPQLDACARGADRERRSSPGPRALFPDHHAGGSDTASFDECSSCCTSAAARSGTRC